MKQNISLAAPATVPLQERRLSPTAVRGPGWAVALGRQTAAEFWKMWRVPAFSAPTIIFPLLLFMLFGVPNAQFKMPDGSTVGKYLLASFGAYGLLGIAFFSFGIGVAVERGQGWTKLVRATPLPAWIFFLAKLLMAILFAVIVLALLLPLGALAAGVRMPLTQWVALPLTLILGMLPFSTVGFTLGYWAGPNSAAPIANLIYLPLSFASGLWQPLETLPKFVQRLAPYLPSYHYGQLVRFAVGVDDGKLTQHILWLAGTLVVGAVLAIWGYRRDYGKQFG